MDLQLSVIENTLTHTQYSIPQVAKNVRYICLQSNCGYQVTSEIVEGGISGRYIWVKVCPHCGVALWKVIK